MCQRNYSYLRVKRRFRGEKETRSVLFERNRRGLRAVDVGDVFGSLHCRDVFTAGLSAGIDRALRHIVSAARRDGANDPRFNKREADQIVIALRDRNYPVEYLVGLAFIDAWI